MFYCIYVKEKDSFQTMLDGHNYIYKKQILLVIMIYMFVYNFQKRAMYDRVWSFYNIVIMSCYDSMYVCIKHKIIIYLKLYFLFYLS